MSSRVNWRAIAGLALIFGAASEAAVGQEPVREARRVTRETPHTSGAINQPEPRVTAASREPSGVSRTSRPITRPHPAVLPSRPVAVPGERLPTAAVRRAPQRVTVIDRSIRPVRPVYRAVRVGERPITRPTYRPIRWGTTVVRLPQRYAVVQSGGFTFYVSDGVFYLRGGRESEYVVVRPPIGMRVTHLPSDATVIGIDNRTFYFYDDVWYDDQLVVVACPPGGWLYALPDEYEEIHYGDDRYFRSGGAVYQPGWRDGRSVYFRIEIDF